MIARDDSRHHVRTHPGTPSVLRAESSFTPPIGTPRTQTVESGSELLAAYRNWDRIYSYGNAAAWVRRVLVNRAISAARARTADVGHTKPSPFRQHHGPDGDDHARPTRSGETLEPSSPTLADVSGTIAPSVERAPSRTADRWALAGLAWTIVIGILWVVVPTGSSGSTTVLSDGTVIEETANVTLLDNEGPGVLLVLAVPVLLAAISAAASRLRDARAVRFIAGGLLLVGCVLGAASVGLPYMPAALALLVAAGHSPASARSSS